MKRCPSCNQTFDEEWLSFCTKDGTTLIEDAGSASEPPPTMMAPPPVMPGPEPVNLNLPPAEYGAPERQFGEQPIQPAWQPPPPPLYARSQNKSLATASMVLGILSITVGWFCIGPIPAIIAIILGLMALSQMKKNPDHYGGQPFAWTGIITGGLMLLIYGGIMLFYVIMIAIAASANK
jgi:Domain of unknown function (DUF4190)